MLKLTKHIEIPIITLILGLLFIAIQLITGPNYPIFRDELYYIDCANHPAFGYVDHPPLSIWILMVWKFIFGDSQISLRIIPALSGAVLIMLTSLLTKELATIPPHRGGQGEETTPHMERGVITAQIFAAVTVFSGLYYLATGGFYSMNVFDSVFWALLFLILVKIIKTSPKSPPYQGGDVKGLPLTKGEWPKAEGVRPPTSLGGLWLFFGITAGLGLMNKISVGYLGLGIFIAILLTKNRVWLKQKHIWLSGLIALVIFSPYIIWNVFNDFATLEFIRNAQRYKIAAISPLDFMKEQVLLINPLSAPVWIAGLIALLFGFRLSPSQRGPGGGIINTRAPFRIIGITYLVILVLLVVMKSKPYYLAAVYPVLIAAGAAYVSPSQRGPGLPDEVSAQAGGGNSRYKLKSAIIYAYMFLLLISTAVFSPMVIPVLPPEQAAEHIKRLGIMPSSGETNRQSDLPQILADRFGWQELTEKVTNIYSSLPENEKKYTLVYAGNYGEAGAINYYGKKWASIEVSPYWGENRGGLCISGHNSHWLWGPPTDSVTTLIIIGGKKEDHLETFSEVTLMDSTNAPYAMPFETGVPIYLARGLKKPLKEVWASIKDFI